MNKLIIMLVLVLGIIACDKNEHEFIDSSSVFESIELNSTRGNSVLINTLIDSDLIDCSYSIVRRTVYDLFFINNDNVYKLRFSIISGDVELIDCEFNNEKYDKQNGINTIINTYYSNVRN